MIYECPRCHVWHLHDFLNGDTVNEPALYAIDALAGEGTLVPRERWDEDCHACERRIGDHTIDGRCPADAGLLADPAETERLRAALDDAQLRSIEARNPGIDMDEVRRSRLAAGTPEEQTPDERRT